MMMMMTLMMMTEMMMTMMMMAIMMLMMSEWSGETLSISSGTAALLADLVS